MPTSSAPRTIRSALALLLVAALLAGALLALGGCATSTVVSAHAGKIQGQVTPNGVVAFKGIPYAAARR